MSKTMLDSRILHPMVYASVVGSMKKNLGIGQYTVRFNRFDVQKMSGRRFRKPKINVTYSIKRCRKTMETTVKSSTNVYFRGIGNIPYKVTIIVSITGCIPSSQYDIVKEYTYALTKAYLEEDKTLVMLYPRDLEYPPTLSKKSQLLDTNVAFIPVDGMKANRMTNEVPESTTSFSKEDEERFHKMIDDYNNMQKKLHAKC